LWKKRRSYQGLPPSTSCCCQRWSWGPHRRSSLDVQQTIRLWEIGCLAWWLSVVVDS
jgi:hypothetical protein